MALLHSSAVSNAAVPPPPPLPVAPQRNNSVFAWARAFDRPGTSTLAPPLGPLCCPSPTGIWPCTSSTRWRPPTSLNGTICEGSGGQPRGNFQIRSRIFGGRPLRRHRITVPTPLPKVVRQRQSWAEESRAKVPATFRPSITVAHRPNTSDPNNIK